MPREAGGAIPSQSLPQIGQREIRAVFSDQSVNPEPPAALAMAAGDFQHPDPPDDIAQGDGAL